MTPRPKTRIDWGGALAFYVAGGPEGRSFASVSRQFGVSEVSVRKHARGGKCKCCPSEGWAALAEKVDAQAAGKALARAERTRDQRVQQTLRIVDGFLDGIEGDLDAKIADAKLSDLPGIVKLAELLVGQPTDRPELLLEMQRVIVAAFVTAGRFVPAEHREEFRAELDRAVGEVLDAVPELDDRTKPLQSDAE